MENKFFNFINPYLAFIDNGAIYRKPFNWLYTIFAILNILAPLVIFYIAIDKDIFDAPAKFIFAFLLIWIVIAFASWISFQLWWNRKSKVMQTSSIGDDFVATPVFAHLVQTFGEWIGTWIGIVGFLVPLIVLVIAGDEGGFLLRSLGIGFIYKGIVGVLLMPIYGFFIIIFARFLAEQFRALSSIANNTNRNKKLD